MIPNFTPRKVLTVFFISLLAVVARGASGLADFRPLSDEERAITSPQVDPEADVEYLSREIVINDQNFGYDRRLEYHNRLVVYTANGVKGLDVLHLPYAKGDSKIKEFRARVTNPDGSVYDLDKSDLYERKVFKDKDDEGNAMSFSLPHLQVGSFVDYAWIETRYMQSTWSMTMLLEEEWPTRSLTIEISSNRDWSSSLRGFNYDLLFETTKDKKYLVQGNDIAGWKREPFSPPLFSFRPWIYLRYISHDLFDLEKFWDYQSEVLWDRTELYVRPKQGAVKKLAQELFAGAADKEEKLLRAYRYCCEEVTNVNSVRSGYTSEERDKLKEVDSPGETIKRGYGSGFDVACLFASLAGAAGFDARLARVGDTDVMKLMPGVMSVDLNFPEHIVALRDGEEGVWRFFDPGYDYLPFETLDYDNCQAAVMVANKEEVLVTFSPAMISSRNVLTRNADFELNEFGDLSGKVELSYLGYNGLRMKRYYDSLSDKEREEEYLEELRKTFPRCVVKDFEMRNIFTREEALVVSYTIEIPAYGESLGRRIFFQPNFFEYGETAMLTDEERKMDLVFPFPWEERDLIWVKFPEGFTTEEASTPGPPIDTKYLGYSTTFASNRDRTKLRCVRELRVSGNEFVLDGYRAIKGFFDDVNKRDTHVISLVKVKEDE